MARQTGKGRAATGKGSRQKKEAAFTRHAASHSMQQKQFVGDAEPDRAEAEFQKIDHQMQEENREVVREMADQLEKEANALHRPTSLREGVDMLLELRSPETREQLRAKARERLAAMPEPVQFALATAERLTNLMMRPVVRGARLVSDALSVPAALFRVLTHREA